MAKGKKTGGRVKGSKNKRTVAQLELAQIKSRKTPLEVMLEEMHKPINAGDPTLRLQLRQFRVYCASQAAPYMHSKLSSIEHRTPASGIDVNISGKLVITADPNDPQFLEYARRVAFVMALGAKMAARNEKLVNPPSPDMP